jgi:hypothetical protein
MKKAPTQYPTDDERAQFKIAAFKGIEVGLGQDDPMVSVASKLEAQYPNHLVLIQAGKFLHAFDRSAHALATLKGYQLKLIGTVEDPHLRVGCPAGMIELTATDFRGYIPLQVRRNTSASGMSPRKSVAFFTSIGLTPMGGSERQYKTRKGNTVRRLAAVSTLLPTPRRNGFKSQQGA